MISCPSTSKHLNKNWYLNITTRKKKLLCRLVPDIAILMNKYPHKYKRDTWWKYSIL